MRVGAVNKLKKEIEKHKLVVARTKSQSAKTNAINCINRKLKMIKCWEHEGNLYNAHKYNLDSSERYAGEHASEKAEN